MNRSSIFYTFFFLILPYCKIQKGKGSRVYVVNTNIRYESLFLMKSARKAWCRFRKHELGVSHRLQENDQRFPKIGNKFQKRVDDGTRGYVKNRFIPSAR